MYKEIFYCRICKSTNLYTIVDLGKQELTGMFPLLGETCSLEAAPIEVIRCKDCGLVQLRHSVTPESMFNDGYGYASSLNSSMVAHLKTFSSYIENLDVLKPGDTIVDIACNDGTFLKFFKGNKYNLVGIDPSSNKYRNNFNDMTLVVDFFSKEAYNSISKSKAKVITSFACFYDLEDPLHFAKDIKQIISDDGIWILEMAYLPFILQNLAYDGCCHEHLSYYSFHDIYKIYSEAGFKLVDLGFNEINGGSFWVSLTPKESSIKENTELASKILQQERIFGLQEEHTYALFKEKVLKHKQELTTLITTLSYQGYSLAGLGASTKFNVILQYCNITKELLSKIGDVNSYKFTRMTPGTNIPIINEDEILDPTKFQYLVVGPYHFKENILKQEKIKKYRQAGGKLIFPLPVIEIIT